MSANLFLAGQEILLSTRRLRFRDDPELVTARIWASILAEPGDSVLGALLEAVWPVAAVNVILISEDKQELSQRLAEYGLTSVSALKQAYERWRPRVDLNRFRQVVLSADSLSAYLVVPGDPDWPVGLSDLGIHAPVCLWGRGDSGLLRQVSARGIAIVGARAATGYGENCAGNLASGLAESDVAVVSGGAYGIDGAAHRAALASEGITAAIMAGGIDNLYPSGQRQMLERIIDSGVLISEAPPGTVPSRWRFLQRNRLIAAISRATVVVEAGIRSGSLNTAAHAAQLGRPLGAVPGPITSAASAGCHRLLRDIDAICVTDTTEVLELAGLLEYGDQPVAAHSTGAAGSSAGATSSEAKSSDGEISASRNPEVVRVLDAMLTRKTRSVAEIAAIAGLAPTQVMAQLAGLQIDGLVSRRDSGWVLAPKLQ